MGLRPWGPGRRGVMVWAWQGQGCGHRREEGLVLASAGQVAIALQRAGAEPGKGWWSSHTLGSMGAARGQGCMGRRPWRGESG